jgi:hypothetical protein
MTARTQSPSDSDMEATAFGHVRGRRHRHNQIRFFTIAEVAERLHVATRTIRGGSRAEDLVVHRLRFSPPATTRRESGSWQAIDKSALISATPSGALDRDRSLGGRAAA